MSVSGSGEKVQRSLHLIIEHPSVVMMTKSNFSLMVGASSKKLLENGLV